MRGFIRPTLAPQAAAGLRLPPGFCGSAHGIWALACKVRMAMVRPEILKEKGKAKWSNGGENCVPQELVQKISTKLCPLGPRSLIEAMPWHRGWMFDQAWHWFVESDLLIRTNCWFSCDGHKLLLPCNQALVGKGFLIIWFLG